MIVFSSPTTLYSKNHPTSVWGLLPDNFFPVTSSGFWKPRRLPTEIWDPTAPGRSHGAKVGEERRIWGVGGLVVLGCLGVFGACFLALWHVFFGVWCVCFLGLWCVFLSVWCVFLWSKGGVLLLLCFFGLCCVQFCSGFWGFAQLLPLWKTLG